MGRSGCKSIIRIYKDGMKSYHTKLLIFYVRIVCSVREINFIDLQDNGALGKFFDRLM